MGILNEIIGAVVAVEGVKKLDPDASLLTEGIAAFTGYKAVEVISEKLEDKDGDTAEQPVT